MWSPTGKPVEPLSFAVSLGERRDLVKRHPDHKTSGLKPWISAVGVKQQIKGFFGITYIEWSEKMGIGVKEVEPKGRQKNACDYQ